jgi:hypothetical protein
MTSRSKSWIALGFVVLIALVSSCSQPAQGPPATVLVTVVHTEIAEVPVTVEVEVEVEVTVVTTPTPRPTSTPTPEPARGDELAFAANYVATQTQGGLEIQLVRVLCMDSSHFRDVLDISNTEFSEDYGDVPTMCEFILEVSNTADSQRTIYPDQGTVIIGDEQIELKPFDMWSIEGLEDVSGDLYPGVRRVGGFWFGINRSTWDQITSITYVIDSPVDEDWDRQGEDFRFEIDTAGWGFEPYPEDL